MQARAQEVLAFVRQHGPTYPKDVKAHFDHGRIKRWGANLNVSNHLLEGLHYRGLLRVARRDGGTPGVPDGRAPAARRQPRGAARARRQFAGYGGATLRTASCGQPGLCVQTAELWSAAPGRRGAAVPGARQISLCPCSGRRLAVVLGRKARTPGRSGTRSTTGCASSRPSTPWSGTAGASSCSGIGNTSWRPMCQPTSAALVITRCPCYGASECWAGPI